jgi:hypothetical protein
MCGVGAAVRTQYHVARFTELGQQLFPETNQLIFGGGNFDRQGQASVPFTTTLNVVTPTASRTLTIPASVSCNMILDQVDSGAQTINGNTTMFNVTLTGELKLPTSGGTQSALNYYEDWTASGATIGNCVTATACNPRIVRVGKKCTIYFPGLALTSATSTNTMTTTALPSRFYPANSNLRFLNSVINNSAYQIGHIEVSSTTGVITVYSDLNAGTFTNATFVACHPTSFSYLVA